MVIFLFRWSAAIIILVFSKIRMSTKRQSLSNQLSQFASRIQVPKRSIYSLNYQKIINSQQQVIKSLEKEITYLRQYLIYVADFEQNTTKEEEKADESCSLELQNSNSQSTEKTTKKINGLKSLITEVMKIVQAKNPDEILPMLKKMQEKANRKIEPVFVERLKEKEVPIIIQKIKEVQKAVVEQKIVYVQKIVQKIVEKPVFKQRAQKYIDTPQESSFCVGSGVGSPKYGMKKKYNNNYFQSNKSSRYKEKDYDETRNHKKSDKTLKYKQRY